MRAIEGVVSDWEKYVRWPTCVVCKSRGFVVDPKTEWPIECEACTPARKRAMQVAEEDVRVERKRRRTER